MTYHKAKENVPEFPVMKGYKMRCCDCGLVHTIDFTVIKKTFDSNGASYCWEPIEDPTFGVTITARRNNRATGQIRRHKK